MCSAPNGGALGFGAPGAPVAAGPADDLGGVDEAPPQAASATIVLTRSERDRCIMAG